MNLQLIMGTAAILLAVLPFIAPGFQTASIEQGEAIFITHGGNKTEVLDLDNPSCSRRTADLIDRRVKPSINLLNNEVIICGGADMSKNWVDSCIISSTPARGNWAHHSILTEREKTSKYFGEMKTYRVEHSGEVFEDEIYLVAGEGFAARQTSDKFSNGEWVPGPDLPHEVGLGACSVKTGPETMVVTGGGFNEDQAIELNVTSGEWRQLPNMPQKRFWHGCTLYQNYVIVTGSIRWWDSKSTYRLDLNTEQWERIGDMEVGKLGPQLVTVNNRVVALGGKSNDDARRFLDTVEELDTETFTWKKLDVKLKIGDTHTRAVVMDRSILCG